MLGFIFSAKEKKVYPSKCSWEFKEMRGHGSSLLHWWEEIMKVLFGIQGDEEVQGIMVHQSCNGGKKL